MYEKKNKKNYKNDLHSLYSKKTNRFANLLMHHGKKSNALVLLLKSITACKLNFLEESEFFNNKYQRHSHKIYAQVIDQVKPSVETRKVRVGGSVYQVPSITQTQRQEGIAIRWIINSARHKKSTSKHLFLKCLGQEFFYSIKKESQSIQKRDQVHALAAANRAYTRYRWW